MEKVIEVALAEVGYLEKKSAKNEESKTANAGSNNFTKYGAWLGVDGDYWCASFVSWCFHEAYGTKGKSVLGCYSAACETIRKQFDKNGRLSNIPKVGDCIFFTGSRHSGANHIGIVYKVTDSYVYTVEGNTSGASGVVDNGGGVAKKKYAKSNARIMCYGHPAFTANEKTVLATSTTPKPATTYATVSTSSGCNARMRNAKGRKIASVPCGSKVVVLLRAAKTFKIDGKSTLMCKVKYAKKVGYIAQRLLKF